MHLSELKSRLGLKSHPARFFRQGAGEGRVECFLCPRNCKIPEGRSGFCKTRWNEDGKLVTINYGTSVQMTQEVIETEAVLHHSPGAPILSLGNIGCMMNCDYCHNWNTSQMMHVQKQDVYHYTPEQVVQTALNKNIKVISWTYNDPVVWQEFVVDTARLAKKHGLINLYKSAFYIGPEAIDELHEVIDIFSLSLKSMDPAYYLRLTKGRLEPVLEGIKQVYGYKDRHLEVSNLVVTGANDHLGDVEKVVSWVLNELDENIPLHLVRFHPDYKYTHVGRTSIDFLKRARERALEMGLKHVYLGNVFEPGEWLNTRCDCGNLLVERFGMKAIPVGLDAEGKCRECRKSSSVSMKGLPVPQPAPFESERLPQQLSHDWQGDVNSGHMVATNLSEKDEVIVIRHLDSGEDIKLITLKPRESWRFLISRSGKASPGFEASFSNAVTLRFFEVLDRAHYPVQASKLSEAPSALA